jgi:signal transduction histidine kinase
MVEMNKVLGSRWAKMIALALVVVSTLSVAAGAAGILFFAQVRDSNTISYSSARSGMYLESSVDVWGSRGSLRQWMENNMAQNYAAMMLCHALMLSDESGVISDPEESLVMLEDGSLEYSVVETRVTLQNGQLVWDTQTIYGDENRVNEETADFIYIMPDSINGISYNAHDLLGSALAAPYSYNHVGCYFLEDSIQPGQGFLLDPSDMEEGIDISSPDGEETAESGEADAADTTATTSVTDLLIPYGNASEDAQDTGAASDYVENGDEIYYYDEDEDGLISEYKLVSQVVSYRVYMMRGSDYSVNKQGMFRCGVKDQLGMADTLAGYIMLFRTMYMPLFVVGVIVLLTSAIFLCCAAGRRTGSKEIVLRSMDRLPYGIYLALLVLGEGLGISGAAGCAYGFYKSVFSLRDGVLLAALLIALSALLAAAFGMSTAVRIKSRKFGRYTLCHYLISPFKVMGRGVGALLADEKGHFIFTAVVVGAVTLLQLLVICTTDYDVEWELVCFFLYKCVEIPLLFWILYQVEKLRQGGKRVASGDYSQPINTAKMLPPLKEHGENINHVSEGIAVAVEEQMKSERLKTELITNVTHDIKTPLTSIINYVDLIKKENVADPTLLEYIAVLERQSARLKKLIEDLLEASKASTGNIKVKLETCDAGVMLDQVIGEYQEKMSEKGLEIIRSVPENPVYIMADGRHLWRVLDNVMSNIYKYAMENTRVYITIEKTGDGTRLIFKNMSKYQLNISGEELMGRFVRGDLSRNSDTEGHGLGLSIADSLTKLMQGNLSVDIDGDLFKVTITLH